jgi:site-specific DNA-methyltransferase (adenine-specific)
MSGINITNEDCMKLMARCPDKYFYLAIVDPPYGMIDHECRHGALARKSKAEHVSHRRTENSKAYSWAVKYALNKTCRWDVAPPGEYFTELFSVSKEQIIWGGNYFKLPPSRNFIVWNKTHPESFSMAMAEYAWCSISGNAKIITYPPQDKNRFHPTQKPVYLYKKLLQWYAKAGDKILDTHLGSGSSAIACIDMGFDLTGCELDKGYYEKALERIAAHRAQQELFDAKEFNFSGREIERRELF